MRIRDGMPVVVKVYTAGARAAASARIEHEFRLIQGIDSERVVRALALEPCGEDLALVMERFEGVDLDRHRGDEPMALDEFFSIARQIAEALAEVHAQRVIHRDIKPANILIAPATGKVVLGDFGISALLDGERERLHDPEVIEGTLPYLSPEQSGRTRAPIDFRTDLYSLGVTFYELLTGRRPFTGDSPLELLHAHLARRAQPPQMLRPELPAALGAIVMKLLAKAPERRYQSGAGLASDLAHVEQALARGGSLADFAPGGDDVPMALVLPHRVYGRERERAQLLASFRLAAEGQPRMVLLRGPAGIGKSALVAELAGPVLGRRGFVAHSKFDRGSEQPFSALIDAVSMLADQLLVESEARLALWRGRLDEALGGLAPLMIGLVPKLGPVLGPGATDEDEAEAVEAALDKASNRARAGFARLLGAFAKPEHPLVLVLDDLQWADPGSCEILDELLASEDRALLVLATTRDDPLERGHALLELRARAREAEIELETIELGPLDHQALTKLVADVLGRPADEVVPLVQTLERKTGNNPFFVRQFLLQLAELGQLESSSSGWRWDLAAIEAAALPADSLALMVAKLERLDPASQRLLANASVLGDRFELPTLVELITMAGDALESDSADLSPAEIGARLQELVDEGLLAHVEGVFLFGHDRVREAAYARFDDARARHQHRLVGQLLARRAGLDDEPRAAANLSSEQLFDITDHLNRGHGFAALVDTAGTGSPAPVPARRADEDQLLVGLNLHAGQRALRSGAPRTALRYLEIAELVRGQAQSPDRRAELDFELDLALALATGFCGRYEQAVERFSAFDEHELEPQAFAEVRVQELLLHGVCGERARALDRGIASLRELGVRVPAEPGALALSRALASLAWNMRAGQIDVLAAQPPIQDPRQLAIIELFIALRNVAYTIAPKIWVLLVARQVALCRAHGSHPSLALLLMQGALVLANVTGNRVRGVEIADHLLELDDSRPSGVHLAQSMMLRSFIAMWTAPLREHVWRQRRVSARAIEAGDHELATFSFLIESSAAFYGGVHLRTVKATIERYVPQARRWGMQDNLTSVEYARTYLDCLVEGPPPTSFRADEHERELFETQRGLNEVASLSLDDRRAFLAMVASVFSLHREALALIDLCALALEANMGGSWLIPNIRFVHALAAADLLATCEGLAPAERRRLQRLLGKHARGFARLSARGCAFAHLASFLAAERHGLAGEVEAAALEFERSAALAAEIQNPLFEALAWERMAILAERRGVETWVREAARRATERYRHWGAQAKVAQLEARWAWLVEAQPGPATASEVSSSTPMLQTRSSSSSLASRSPSLHSTSLTNASLDTGTILKAWQAISADIRLDEVVDRVMGIALENAGGDRGVLVLTEEGRYLIAAEVEAGQATQVHLGQGLTLDAFSDRLPATLLRWVGRTREALVLTEASTDLRFAADPYVEAGEVRSILCLPVVKRERLVGLLYVENRLTAGGLTEERLETLELLMSHAASAIENARLYDMLRSSELRWRSLVDRLPDLVALVDPEGLVEFINQPLERSARRAIRGRPWAHFVEGEGRDRVARILASIGRGEPLEPAELELDTQLDLPDLGARHYTMRIVPLVVGGVLERIIVVATDTTERRQREREKAALEAQLRQQQRLESLGTLASGVAHEINNPVQGIRGYAGLIASTEGLDPELRGFAEEIDRESERVTGIVRNLLTFSRREQVEDMAPATVSAIVDQTLVLARSLVRRDHIALRVEVPEDLPALHCRDQQIRQVVLNLITNARDALNQRFEGPNPDKWIALDATTVEREGARWVEIAVEDRGGGVPEDVAEHIFDPFFTTKDRDHGTGLGLSVSHGIILEHGGQLRLDNKAGVGARFVIALPSAPG